MRNSAASLVVLALLLAVRSVASGAARENSTELYQKGARLAMDGQIDQAIPVFRKVVEVSPYYCLGHYGLGKAYLCKYGMLDDAIKHLRKSVELDRRFVKGYFYLGMAYFMARNYPQAARAFKEAYRHDDSYIESLYNLGVIYEIMDQAHLSHVYYNRYFEERVKEEEDIVF